MDIRRFSSALLPLVMLLQACSSTPFGQQLAQSFDGQDAVDAPTAASPPPQPAEAPKTSQPNDAVADRPEAQKSEDDQTSAQPRAEASAKPAATTDVQPTVPRTLPERTRPYRITIRLSAADPAAPAEGVTDALRRAGIGFEVETIERVPARELNPSQQQPAS